VFGTPTREELEEHFTDEGPTASAAQSQMAEGVYRFYTEDFLGASHILAPAVEAHIRALAAQAGVIVTRLPVGETPGGVRSLGSILPALAGRLDDRWRHYLQSALVDPLSVNLRNTVAHGLSPVDSEPAAAVLVHIALFVTCLSPGD
jgi:hypothetical protein